MLTSGGNAVNSPASNPNASAALNIPQAVNSRGQLLPPLMNANTPAAQASDPLLKGAAVTREDMVVYVPSGLLPPELRQMLATPQASAMAPASAAAAAGAAGMIAVRSSLLPPELRQQLGVNNPVATVPAAAAASLSQQHALNVPMSLLPPELAQYVAQAKADALNAPVNKSAPAQAMSIAVPLTLLPPELAQRLAQAAVEVPAQPQAVPAPKGKEVVYGVKVIGPELAQNLPAPTQQAQAAEEEMSEGQALGPTTQVDHKLKLIGEEAEKPNVANVMANFFGRVQPELRQEGPLRHIMRDDEESFLPVRGRGAAATTGQGPQEQGKGSAYVHGDTVVITKKPANRR